MKLVATTEARSAIEHWHNRTSQLFLLTERDRYQVLAFLSARPLHTVIMAGWILDHGVISSAHRGTFYGYWDEAGALQGVALIGRNTLFEARTDEALRALAQQAKNCHELKMVMAESDKLEKFWRYLGPGRSVRSLHRETLYDISRPRRCGDPKPELRLATSADLDLIVAAHADMVAEETGIDPLESEPVSFRQRCADRVDRGRVWIYREGSELIFKVDVLTEAAGIFYIEGVWVNPAHRRQGICRRCLSVLHQELLTNGQSICCFVEAENQSASALYRQVGYVQQSHYSKIYL